MAGNFRIAKKSTVADLRDALLVAWKGTDPSGRICRLIGSHHTHLHCQSIGHRLGRAGLAGGVQVYHDKALLRLFLDHRGALVRYAAGIVNDPNQAEDVVQEAWLKFDTAARKQTPDQPLSFLYRIVRNLAIDLRRRGQRDGRLVSEVGQDAKTAGVLSDPSAERIVVARDELRLLRDALDELPERTQIAIEMRRFGDFKLREIADHLGISVTSAHEIIAEGLAHCASRLRSR